MKDVTMREDLLQVRNHGVCIYVLRDGDSLYLLDSGFIGGVACLDRALAYRGWTGIPIRGIILTHGHLDHILNVAKLVHRSGAWVAAPRLDLDHYTGHPVYRGISRITGCMEAVGRKILSYSNFIPDRLIDDGDYLSIWHGLRAVHLPGHTRGHTGYFCESLGLLFSADLFASFSYFTHLPPAFFNDDSAQIGASLERALSLDIIGVFPNHCDHVGPQEHLSRLELLARKSRD
jgi:glyoxylase-like metal-dependent hydrolase (beta-lactamase superfamily II)